MNKRFQELKDQPDHPDHKLAVLFDQMQSQLQHTDMRFPLLMKASEGGGGRGSIPRT